MPRICFLFVLVFLFYAPPLWAEDSLDVTEPVQVFLEGYGTAKMDAAAEVVTENFRDGKPKAVWTYDTWMVLEDIEYERMESKAMESLVDGDQALVRVHTIINTAAGQAEQDELYRLVRNDDEWLIDAMEVGNEDLEDIEQEL
jgi:hypothetical protein